MQFASFKAAAAFARRYARRVDGSARIVRSGMYWRVEPTELRGALYDPEIDAVQRAEGRARYRDEIAETIVHLRAFGSGVRSGLNQRS